MMRRFCTIVLAIALVPLLYAQAGKSKIPDSDWPMIARDLAGTKHSPLKQINTSNVAQLTQAWSYNPRKEGERGGPISGTTPSVVDGLMYVPVGSAVVALDPETGKEIWRHALTSGSARRGVAYWPGDSDNQARIFFTNGRNLIALNAKTGNIDPGFGNEGEVDMVVPYNSPPTVFKNVLIVGANVGELPVGPAGDSRGYDARTGAKLWEFHSVPHPGELGNETWGKGDAWKGRSGTNVWTWYMTADEERGILYMPIGGPSPNYWRGDAPGDNLFGNSVVAVDAVTGKYKWHFQTSHHDMWDDDQPSPPGLIDIVHDGKTIPGLALIGKTGWMFILDRVTGKPIYGVEERPVPKGEVPGEWYSPTQPFPVKPPALSRVTYKKEDLVTAEDTNAAHAAACRELVEKLGDVYNDGPFTPWPFHKEGDPPRSLIHFPGGTGGANWGGTSSDSSLGYVFVNTSDSGSVGWIEYKKPGQNYGAGTQGSNQPVDRASVLGPGHYGRFTASFKDENGRNQNWPCQKPPWGRLIAVNYNTGDVAWEVPLGITDALPEGKQNTGRYNVPGGPITTDGGLLFIGASDDRRFRAFDSKTGKELWVAQLNGNASAIPMTYQAKNGKQYVAVIADSVISFALP